MASLITYNGGLRRIEFGPEDDRRIIRLGRMRAKAAKTFNAHVETIIGDKLANRPHDADTAEWLGGLDEPMLAKLRKVGLADGVGLASVSLGAFLERYFETMSVKPSTRTFYGHTRRNLEKHFGKTRLLRDISASDADAWRAWLVETEGLSPATVSRRVVAARTMWRKAVRWKHVAENPFDGVRTGHQANDGRKRFIPTEDINSVLEAAPDAEWRAIIALARYGGLRTPSETFALKWGDIDWDRGTMLVTCPKLAHHETYASRVIPLFPELRKPLLTLFGEAEPGTEYVIARYRLGCANLRTHFERIIKRAGLKAWPRLFHNLRASRETELMREYDLATVCKWIGNSPAVAARHYATSVDLDGDFRRAAGLDVDAETVDVEAQQKAQRKAQQTGSAEGGHDATDETPDPEKTLEKQGFCASCRSDAHAVETVGWAQQDSNLRPADYESAALTN